MHEILSVRVHIKAENIVSQPYNVLQYICKNNLQGTFSNLFVSFRIVLTLLISVASDKHYFSKLKIIKNYLNAKRMPSN